MDRYFDSIRHELLLECKFLCCLLLDSFILGFDILYSCMKSKDTVMRVDRVKTLAPSEFCHSTCVYRLKRLFC